MGGGGSVEGGAFDFVGVSDEPWLPCDETLSAPSDDVTPDSADVAPDSSEAALGAPLDDGSPGAVGGLAAGFGLISMASSCKEFATASAQP